MLLPIKFNAHFGIVFFVFFFFCFVVFLCVRKFSEWCVDGVVIVCLSFCGYVFLGFKLQWIAGTPTPARSLFNGQVTASKRQRKWDTQKRLDLYIFTIECDQKTKTIHWLNIEVYINLKTTDGLEGEGVRKTNSCWKSGFMSISENGPSVMRNFLVLVFFCFDFVRAFSHLIFFSDLLPSLSSVFFCCACFRYPPLCSE